jgi:DNA-binding NarL/FixJ family response regulator
LALLKTNRPNEKTSAWRLLVVDDHPLFLEGISHVLKRHVPNVHIETAATAEEGLAKAATTEVDLVLLDLSLPGIDGYAAMVQFLHRTPPLPVVVVSAKERTEDIRRALHAGASGYIPKSLPMHDLVQAVRRVLDGEIYIPEQKPAASREDSRANSTFDTLDETEPLSLRQIEVLTLLCHGKTNKQAAQELALSEKTIKSHVTTIFRALGVVNRTQAVLAAKRFGLVKN